MSLISLLALIAVPTLAGQGTPVFRYETELFLIHVEVVAPEGKPMPRLTAAQFDVRVDGKKRPVVIAEFLHNEEGPVTKVRSRADAKDLFARQAAEFERVSPGINAHYVLGIAPLPGDGDSMKKVRVKVNQKGVTQRQWMWGVRTKPLNLEADAPMQRISQP